MRETAYRGYLLSVLVVILAFNYVDRLALGLLLQDIKADIGLSDTQLGLLTGIAFALFYSVMGIPIARWADRGNRVAIIASTAALWSIAVALCGAAANFVQLLLIRVSVAVGEAGCVPPAHSLIADYYDRAERPRALARYMLGVPLSSVIGYFVAGWLNELYGWRVTFVLLGGPGVLLAVLAWFTLKEPRIEARKAVALSVSRPGGPEVEVESARRGNLTLRQVAVELWSNVTFRHLAIGYSVACLFGYGVWQWKPAFFIRSFGLGTGEVGTWLAVIYGIGGVLGLYWGGELAARLAAHNERLQLRAIAVAYCSFGAVSAAMYLSTDQHLAFLLLAVSTVGIYTTHGPLFAAVQTLAPPRMRAIAIAIVYLCSNLIGMGLGPLAAGVLSDLFSASEGRESLRYALLALSPGYLWAAWHLWRASNTVMANIPSHEASVLSHDGPDAAYDNPTAR